MADGGDLLGLIGGTFNPVHYGHLLAAEFARCEFGLSKVIFIPSARPPHKDGGGIADPRLRCRMVELAIRDNPYFEVSTLELERPGLSFTIDTLEYYREHYPGTTIYFIMGADSLLLMNTWKDVDRLAASGCFIVVTRPGYEVDWKCPPLANLPPILKKHTRFLEMPGMDISSSNIRWRLSQKKSVKYLLPPQVEEYIYSRHLYAAEGEKSL